MNFEKRTIRPFQAFQKTEDLLREHSAIVATDGSESVQSGETMLLDRHSFTTAGIDLRIAPGPQELSAIRKAFAEEERQIVDLSGAVSLVVLLSTPRLRYTDVVHCISLTGPSSIPRTLQLAERSGLARPRALRTPRGGCTIDLVLALDTELDRQPLRPWRKGSWLARLGFRVRSQVHDSGFQPLPLTEDVRRELGIGPGAHQFVRRRDAVDSVARANTLDSVIEFYVDEATLRLVTEEPRSAVAVELQIRFVLDAVKFFAVEASTDEELDDFVPVAWEDTVIHALARTACDGRSPDEDDIIEQVDLLRRRPFEFVARLEHAWDMQGATKTALEGKR